MSPWRWLGVAVLTYTVCHHLGSLPEGLGQAGDGTRWVDWIDLTTPLLVLSPLGLALRSAGAREVEWLLAGVGAVVYSMGHGIHLAANSVGNTAPGPTAHLWDEPVGHHVWFAGLALVVAAVARVLARSTTPTGPLPWLLAAVAGLTWGTNAVGGGAEVMSAALALLAAAWAVRHRRTAAVLLLPLAVASLLAGAVALLSM